MPLRLLTLFLVAAATLSVSAQISPLSSQVYAWPQTTAQTPDRGEIRAICSGSCNDLDSLEVIAVTLAPGQLEKASQQPDSLELYVIVKSGTLTITLPKGSKELGEHGVAIILPGEDCQRLNEGSSPVTYYLFRYKARQPADPSRGMKAGGSQLIAWDSLTFTPSTVGGRRNVFNRATSMFSNAEMHVTMLNANVSSHAAHSHADNEIILVIRGDVEMEIGDHANRGSAGDLFFLGSEVRHGIRNVGSEPAEYYAFRW